MSAHAAHLPALLAGFAQRLGHAAGMNAELMLRLAELRAVHEEVLNSYNALRNFVCDNGFAPPQPGFLNLPEADGGITLPEEVSEVVQPLPVDMRSLCGFALYLPQAVPPFADGTLHVELLAAEDDSVLLGWQTPYTSLPQGWVTFAFEQSERFWRLTPVLRLRFATNAGPAPQFSLAPAQLRAGKAVVIDGTPDTRTLAFKTWTSIPGAPLTVSNQMWPVIRLDNRATLQIELALDETLDAVSIPGQEERTGFALVTKLPAQRRLQVHPFEGMVSLARMPQACPAGTSMVIAMAGTGHPNAGRIEYALAVVPAAEGEAVTHESGLPATAQTSQWVALPPETPGQLHLRLHRPLREAADLFLMTRLAEGESSAYGWAQFRKLSLRGHFSA